MRTANPGEVPLCVGNLDATLTCSAPLALWNKRAVGGETISIRQGRIDSIPVLGRIVTSPNNTLANTLGRQACPDGHWRRGLQLCGQRHAVRPFRRDLGGIGAAGSGTVGFDRQLDLRLNAGPMETLQSSLGPVGEGECFDAMAYLLPDKLMQYRIINIFFLFLLLSDPQVH